MNDVHDNPMTECRCQDCQRVFYKEEHDGNEKFCLKCVAIFHLELGEDDWDDRE